MILFTKESIFQHIGSDLVGKEVVLYKSENGRLTEVVKGVVSRYNMHHTHDRTKLTIDGITYSGNAFDKIQLLNYDDFDNEIISRVHSDTEIAGKHKRSKKSRKSKTKKSRKSRRSKK